MLGRDYQDNPQLGSKEAIMRLSRTGLVAVLAIVAGGVIGATLSFSLLGSRSNDVPAPVRSVLVRPVPDGQSRVFDECADDGANRLLGWADKCADVLVEAVPEDTDLSAVPRFTPMTVRPEILNRGEVLQALMGLYPPALRDAGIGGTVEVWFFISEDGTVLDSRVSEPSTHVQLNEAALEVANVFKFSPALNREAIVEVWIQLPITFEVR